MKQGSQYFDAFPDLVVAGGGKIKPEGAGGHGVVNVESVAGDDGNFAGRGLAAECQHINGGGQSRPEKQAAFGVGAGDSPGKVGVDAGEHEITF